jgi:hypothetical protein
MCPSCKRRLDGGGDEKKERDAGSCISHNYIAGT